MKITCDADLSADQMRDAVFVEYWPDDMGEFQPSQWDANILTQYGEIYFVEYVGRNQSQGQHVARMRHRDGSLYTFVNPRDKPTPPVGRWATRSAVLMLAALLLPEDVRADWLEEQRAYLADLPTRRARLLWLCLELVGMPRYSYTVHTRVPAAELVVVAAQSQQAAPVAATPGRLKRCLDPGSWIGAIVYATIGGLIATVIFTVAGHLSITWR